MAHIITAIVPRGKDAEALERWEHELDTEFGGFTRTEGYGSWQGGTEDVWMYTILASNEDYIHARVWALQKHIIRGFKQEAAYVTAEVAIAGGVRKG